MKKNIFAFLIGLAVSLMTFWGPTNVFSPPGARPNGNLYTMIFSGLFLNHYQVAMALYLIACCFGFLIYWFLMRVLGNKMTPFPFIVFACFLVGVLLPMFLYFYILFVAFSNWQVNVL
jgi:hypothetical protein